MCFCWDGCSGVKNQAVDRTSSQRAGQCGRSLQSIVSKLVGQRQSEADRADFLPVKMNQAEDIYSILTGVSAGHSQIRPACPPHGCWVPLETHRTQCARDGSKMQMEKNSPVNHRNPIYQHDFPVMEENASHLTAFASNDSQTH